jgi:glycosyltransferase involved in cell wall biosynthesis
MSGGCSLAWPGAGGEAVPKVLWIGPLHDGQELDRDTAVSPAAVRWSNGFLSGLRANGVGYRHVGFLPRRAWPYGPAWVPGGVVNGAGIGVPYLNLPRIRPAHQARGLTRCVLRQLADDRPDMLVTYNAEPNVAGAARAAAARGVPWFPIVMDFDDRLLDRSWQPITDMVRGAAGVAFLSRWACEACPLPRVFHIDGGIEDRGLPDRFDGPAGVVLYTGTRAPWGGLDLLLKAWRGVRHPGARLYVCGPGRSAAADAAVAADPRIVDFGMVSESHLRTLTEQAAVLVNPRPPFHPGNRFNFPSKVLEYLGTGKPVVSTRTPSFGPGYESVLFFAENETAAALGRAIDRALALTAAEREAHRELVRRFVSRHGGWREVTAAFLRWAAECVRNPDAPAVA